MKRLLPILLLVLPCAVRADPVTNRIPKSSVGVLRLASADRIDAVAKEWLPILQAFGAKESALHPVREAPLSTIFFAEAGLEPSVLDKAKPFYFAFTDFDRAPLFLGHAGAGAVWEGRKALKDGVVAVRRGDALIIAEPSALALETRGAPTPMLDGDASIHLYLGELIEAHRAEFMKTYTAASAKLATLPVIPPAVRPLAPALLSMFKSALFSVDAFDYAVTWSRGELISQGRLTTRPASPMRALLSRAGPAADHDLAAFLPENAFFIFDFSGNPDWPGKELGALVDGALGKPGAWQAIAGLLDVTGAFSSHLTGHFAGAIALEGLMNGSTIQIAELAPGTDPTALFQGFDPSKANPLLAELGVPIQMKFEPACDEYKGVKLHRITLSSSAAQFAMAVSMTRTCLAADSGYLMIVSSPTAERDISDLIDKVRAGKPRSSAHLEAMARLGGTRNLGLTVNPAALKNFAVMMGAFVPELARFAAKLPDSMPISTAVTFSSGDLAWRGNWPVQEIAQVAKAIRTMREGSSGSKPTPPPPEKEKDFD